MSIHLSTLSHYQGRPSPARIFSRALPLPGVLLGALLLSTCAAIRPLNVYAATLSVDFGHTNPGNDVQAGFEFFSLGAAGAGSLDGVSSPQTRTFASDVGVGGSLDITLASPAAPTTLGSRDRGDVTHALGDMAEDFIFNTEPSDELRLTMSTLKSDAFLVTTWFHDRDFSTQGMIDIFVTDALGASRQVADNLQQSSGASPTTISSATFLIGANGSDPVTLSFQEDTAALNVVLAGLEIQALGIPEPNTLWLLSFGAMTLVHRSRRSRLGLRRLRPDRHGTA